jgi:hypothetical protein
MERIRQIETLIAQIESAADPEMRARVQELVEAILEFHGAGLERMLELAGEGSGLVREFARDELVSSMLLLYDLHPDDFSTRVQRAVDSLPAVELLGVEGKMVRLRALRDGVDRDSVERVIYAAAPEASAVEIENLEPVSGGFVPLDALTSR